MKAGIIGDILGSTFEGYQWSDRNLPWTAAFAHQGVVKLLKDTSFVRTTSFWTDDTLCTLGLWKGYSQGLPLAETLRDFCLTYGDINSGFGSGFKVWLKTGEATPSYGNGCIMRLGFIPNLPISLEEKKDLAKQCTVITHNHPDALVAVSRFVELADQIKKEGKQALAVQSVLSVEEYHAQNKFEIHCGRTLDQAIAIVRESNSLEEVYRNAFYVGGDADTLACIAGNLAESLFEIPTPWLTLMEGTLEGYPEMRMLLEQHTLLSQGH